MKIHRQILISILLIFLFKNLYALDFKCDFEEVYLNGETQNGILITSDLNLRYQYQDQNLYTIIKNKKGTFLIQNSDTNLLNNIDNNQIISSIVEIYKNFPDIKNSYAFDESKIIIEKSGKHDFIKRLSIQSNKLNVSINFYNCNSQKVEAKTFQERPFIDII